MIARQTVRTMHSTA